MERIPVTIAVSRKTGQIVGVERGNVTEETFRKVCQELIKGGKEANHGQAADRDGNRDGAGNRCNPDLHGQDGRLDREAEA